ncbi:MULTISPECIES: helix-turn-helix domain-containing protein [unclassified Candidatus Frackibacter]|uniref:helix-turn-helix domain-containing protein n=1 Tax=unclassified Candidatus Frackibacter TaxID=2648818 RepID=UPI00088D9A2A|nr:MULTISPECIES: MerR family transcriptional regulator [unclassified Candidatus Frackibacter]SDB97514.1 MerR family transcriptional regulator, Zn(II)-responsive regulator of zntA [Candidatus Frackibacter sp. WG11]SEM29205.1 MerR family transcriptional regulator, Zn(II)-responsive regulator of zntA [Candidatus Frackibacter sp. WG12]SFL34066.1 MerR family transcriptional regulator, Zn(II)-responsive regulator of zntA [Candidatus Frackibacter sp. WG13]
MGRNKQELLKIGELAERAGVTKRTIRYYEELGLLSPSERSEGGFRLYNENDLSRLLFINRFKEIDFPLDKIKELIDSIEIGDDKSGRVSASLSLLGKQLQQVEEEIQSLRDTKANIKSAIDSLNQCKNCEVDKCPPGCEHKNAML